MTLHIGIIGCSAEGAALCYRTICTEGPKLLGGHAHPEVSVHTQSLDEYVACLQRDDLQGVARLMLDSANKLCNAGAELLICPDNTLHRAYDLLADNLPRPWLHIAHAVVAAADSRPFRRVGLMGTHWLTDSNVYPQAFATHGIECVRPNARDRTEVSHIIMEELVRGIVRPQSVERLRQATGHLRDAGCDAVVLGCTELPLVLSDDNAALPTLDSTRLLARAALQQAVSAP